MNFDLHPANGSCEQTKGGREMNDDEHGHLKLEVRFIGMEDRCAPRRHGGFETIDDAMQWVYDELCPSGCDPAGGMAIGPSGGPYEGIRFCKPALV